MDTGFVDVSDISNAGSIPAGNVVAASESPGYIAVVAMIAAGDAELLADQYLPDRRRVVFARVGASHNPRQMQVTVSQRGFEMAHKMYTDWKIAWWREVVQNSVDAKARNIALGATEVDGNMVASCDDDGIGMDLDTIENRFLAIGALGAEGKGTGAAVGGFGEAKKILCFKWPKWELYSRDNYLLGSNGTAEAVEQEPRKGTLVQAWMPMQTNEFTRIEHASEFLARCHFTNINFTLNGTPWGGPWLYKGRLLKEIRGEKVDAAMYYTKESKRLQARCYVRLNGMYMHTIDISSYKITGYVIIELKPKTDPSTGLPYSSIEYLESNRDRIRDPLFYEIHSELDFISRERERALIGPPKSEPVRFEGAGKFKAEVKQKEATLLYNMKVKTKGDEAELDKDSVESVTLAMKGAEGISDELLQALLTAKYTGQTQVETALKQIAGYYWKKDFFTYPDGTVNDFTIPKKFYPDTQTPGIHKLARVWADFCLYVMVALNCDKPFWVGWVFSKEFSALHLRKDGEDHLLLNPYIIDRRILKPMGKTLDKESYGNNPLYNPSNQSQLEFIFSLAVHEATHFVDDIEDHDPSFASAFTYNMALCGPGFKQLRRIAAGARAKAREEREAPGQEPEPVEETVAATPAEGAVFPLEGIREAFSNRYPGLSDHHFFRAVKSPDRIPYPDFSSPMNFESSILRELSYYGLPVFALKNEEMTLIIPSSTRPLTYIQYALGMGLNSRKRDVLREVGRKFPTLFASLNMEPVDLVDAWMNRDPRPEGRLLKDLIYVDPLTTYQSIRDHQVGSLARRLGQEYTDFRSTCLCGPEQPDEAWIKAGALTRFGTDYCSVEDNFANHIMALVLSDVPLPEESVKAESEYIENKLRKFGIETSGYASSEAPGVPIPNFGREVTVAEHILIGNYAWARYGNNLALITPAANIQPFSHSFLIEPLARCPGRYAYLILIGQMRMIDFMNYDLSMYLIIEYKYGRRPSVKPWAQHTLGEIEKQLRLAIEERIPDCEVLFNMIDVQIENHIKPWIKQQIQDYG